MRQNREVEFRFEPFLVYRKKQTDCLLHVLHTKAITRLSVVE